MFVIESGKVKRVKGDIQVDELGEDDVSGMLHLFTQDPCFATLIVRFLPALRTRTSTCSRTRTRTSYSCLSCLCACVCVQCEEETVVWSLSAKEFKELLGAEESTLAAKLLIIFSKQLRENSKVIRKKKGHDKYFARPAPVTLARSLFAVVPLGR
jgi:CRP-like cAMP-binding protein